MSTICKKEIRAYLTSMSGYVFIAFMLLVTGIYFTAYHMNMAYPIFGYTLSAVNFIFLIDRTSSLRNWPEVSRCFRKPWHLPAG